MTLIPLLIAVYAAICAVVYFGHRLFMYFPNQTRAAPAEAGVLSENSIRPGFAL